MDDALASIETALAGGLHAAGFLSYELGHAFEPRLRPLADRPRCGPLICMGLFEAVRLLRARDIDTIFGKQPPPPPLTEIVPGHDRTQHRAKVDKILDLIGAGDLYQANLTFPIRFRYAGDPLSLYAVLRSRQPTAHSALVALDDAWVLSVSPELFVRVEDGVITSRPMKGTAARAPDPDADADATAVSTLLADPKQRAENMMITDLIRNDLARISQPGSVRSRICSPRRPTPPSTPSPPP